MEYEEKIFFCQFYLNLSTVHISRAVNHLCKLFHKEYFVLDRAEMLQPEYFPMQRVEKRQFSKYGILGFV